MVLGSPHPKGTPRVQFCVASYLPLPQSCPPLRNLLVRRTAPLPGPVLRLSGNNEVAKDNIWRVPMAEFGLATRAEMETPERYIHGFNVLLGRVAPPAEAQTTEETKKLDAVGVLGLLSCLEDLRKSEDVRLSMHLAGLGWRPDRLLLEIPLPSSEEDKFL